ncbi:oxygen-dependent tRNA uridine(34) hydroxylase TrhO [Henriciella aquimarina]|uniref:oxygen-dependent tRNA uridine(34) hydroxylase TrhO n=1 Tax=Henriciella aquimarina TaxID=545261 RepID=UPI0009FE2C84|nr:rhodanese-related sulfurtransferase [Henriciella aquimarina]
MSVRVSAFYKFVRFDAPDEIRARVEQALAEAGAKGTVLVAAEGLNGTIAAEGPALDQAIAALTALPGCADLDWKESHAEAMPFWRLKVRLKREIVTMGVPGTDPNALVGTYVEPEDWNALISDPDTVVIDTRNDYEFAIGTFEGAVDPETKTFREFPDWFRSFQQDLESQGRKPKVAMFCTGGIRCEKATSFVKAEGVDDVFHLKGGILKYLETVPAPESKWQGECFVFDQRVSVGHGLELGSYELCHGCKRPVSAEDRADPRYEEGISCPACHDSLSEEQRARFAERQKQVELARQRGMDHIGRTPAKSST